MANFPYEPRVYRPNSTIAQLMLEQGNQQADSARNLWGGIGQTVAGLGQEAGQLIQQKQEQKKVEAQKAEMSKRDAAWVSYVESGEWSKDPQEAYKVTTRIWGPTKEAEEHFKGLQGASQLMQPKRDPAADAKSLGAVIGAIDATPEGPGRARLYQAALPLAKSAFPTLEAADQYTPEQWGEISALGKQLRGEKPVEAKPPGTHVVAGALVDDTGKVIYKGEKEAKEAKTYEVTVPGPDGRPIKRLATASEMAKGVPQYVAPEKAAPPGKLTKDERQEFDSIDYALPKMDSFESYVTANRGKFGKWDSFAQGLKQQVPGLSDQDYASKKAFVGRLSAEIRHALFGSALSEGEKASAESFIINESDQPEQILAKLADARDRMRHKVQYYEGLGYKVGSAPGGGKSGDGLGIR